MLLRNGDKRVIKPELCIKSGNLIKLSNPQILNVEPLKVAKQYSVTNQFHKENFRSSNDSTRCHDAQDVLLPSSSMKDTNTSNISSIPPQLQSPILLNRPTNPNIQYHIPPLYYQNYHEVTSSSSYVSQGIHIQQNVISTTTMISPTQMPQLINSNPLCIHDVNAYNNIMPSYSSDYSNAPQFYQAHNQNVIQSPTSHQSPESSSSSSVINHLSHSFMNLTTDSPSTLNTIEQPLSNSCRLPSVNTNSNNHLSSFTDNLSCAASKMLNHSSISLPPQSPISARPLNNDPLSSSSSFPSPQLSLSQQRKTDIANLSSYSSSQLQSQSSLSSFNAGSLTPSRRMINVMEERVLIPPTGITNPVPNIMHITKKINCNPNIMKCTLNAVPTSDDLLAKTRLPLAILLHPFRDLPSLQVIRSKKIIRCRTLSCRAYINPFVTFTDQKRWKCNMCLRMNELSDDSIYNHTTGEYLDTLKRFELRLPTVEYIAPKEYSLKNTQSPVYVFLIDISYNATIGLYSNTMAKMLSTIEQMLDRIPGYQHAKFALIGYDSVIHLYTIGERGVQEIVISDISSQVDVPVTNGLVIDMETYHDTIQELLTCVLDNVDDSLPHRRPAASCLGTALLVAKQLFQNRGGRITIFNASCPTVGKGILTPRDYVKSTTVWPLSPDIEFYKSLSQEFDQAQISVDLFQLGDIPCDLASLSILTRYCSGSLFYYPNLSNGVTTTNVASSPEMIETALNETQRLLTDLHRYLTRKIGFEAILRVRFSAGFNILSSHGNFFARASDLYSMANVNPDSGVAIRLGIEDNFTDLNTVYFQAALLYTSSSGERRIRVHTLCLPVIMQIEEIFRMADHQAIVALLAKSVADRLQLSGNVAEAREALINAVVDPSVAFGKFCLSSSQRVTALPFPFHLRMLPLYVWGLLQSKCLRVLNNSVDLSVSILDSWRNMPLSYLLVDVYPNLYNVIGIVDLNSRQTQMFQSSFVEQAAAVVDPCLIGDECNDDEVVLSSEESERSSYDSDPDSSNISCYHSKSAVVEPYNHLTKCGSDVVGSDDDDDEDEFWYPDHVHLTMQSLSRCGVFLLDSGSGLMLLMGADTPRTFLKLIFDVDRLADIRHDGVVELPDLNNACSAHLRVFIRQLQVERPLGSALFIVNNDTSILNRCFLSHLIEDDQHNASYNRFLQHVQKKVINHS